MQRRVEPARKLKLQAYLPAELKLEVERQAAVLGQPISTFVARALAAAVIKGKAAALKPFETRPETGQ